MPYIKKLIVIASAAAIAVFSGCAGGPSGASGPVYSNLADESSRELLSGALIRAGAGEDSVLSLMESIEEYNAAIEGVSLAGEGFAELGEGIPDYDAVRIDELWQRKYPDFIGYNCRITAFQAMKDIITVETLSPEGSYGLLMDDAALDASARTVFNSEERRRFETVYSIVPTDSSTDADAQYAVHKKYWEEAGVSFGGTDISLISVCLHNHFSEESNELLIGHTGVLLRDGEDYLFFEKLSFQLPYQLIRFADKAELRAYLMAAYDVDYTGESARPFILENGALLGSGEQL